MMGIAIAAACAAAGAQAAGPTPATGTEIVGWAEPGPADLAVLEGLEGENLAEARNTKGTTLKIESAKKDLDGDGIPEYFFFVRHPLFCYEEAGGCSLIIVRRVSLSEPWREVGVLTVPAPGVLVMPSKGREMPTLRPLGAQPYAWDGELYQPAPTAAAAAPESEKR
jgi:hypothetical protein